jgi:hypothetical protein
MSFEVNSAMPNMSSLSKKGGISPVSHHRYSIISSILEHFQKERNNLPELETLVI